MTDRKLDRAGMDAALAEIRREFGAGLVARVESMQADLESLTRAYDDEVAKQLFARAHALEGTAGTLSATELADAAAALAVRVRSWRDGRVPDLAALNAAHALLAALARAAAEFRARTRSDER